MLDTSSSIPATQIELEALFSKYQLLNCIRYEFIEAGFVDELSDKGIIPEFGINAMAQLVLHKRATLPTMVGILRKHLEGSENPSQAAADMLLKMAQEDFIDWDGVSRMFVMKFDISQDVKEKLALFQYPLPMIEEPLEIRNNRETGYFSIRRSVILKDNHHEDDVCLDHLNRVNATPLSINADVVAFVNNSWRNLDRKKDDETLEEYQRRLAAFQKYDEVSRDVIDTLSLQHDRFWLTHRYDKRGRTYVSGYHVNYQSNDWCKAVVEFADGEKLND